MAAQARSGQSEVLYPATQPLGALEPAPRIDANYYDRVVNALVLRALLLRVKLSHFSIASLLNNSF